MLGLDSAGKVRTLGRYYGRYDGADAELFVDHYSVSATG